MTNINCEKEGYGFYTGPDLTEMILRLLPASGSITDIGCGDGSLLKKLAAEQGTDRILTGVDPAVRTEESQKPIVSSIMETGRKEENFREKGSVTFLYGFAEHIPLSAESQDAAVLSCVFSLCRPEETVKELFRILKTDGTLIIADLFAKGEPGQCRAGRLDTADGVEAYFLPYFQKISFSDESDTLVTFAAQAILDDMTDSCSIFKEMQELKEHHAGYGLWVWKKN